MRLLKTLAILSAAIVAASSFAHAAGYPSHASIRSSAWRRAT